MSDFRCSCPSRTLLWQGCQCSHRRSRTIPINLSIPEVGFKAAWQLVYSHLSALDPKKVAKLKEPSDVESLMQVMWWIESQSPDLYDNLARLLEEMMRNKGGTYPYGVRLNLNDRW